jgi:dynein light chain 1
LEDLLLYFNPIEEKCSAEGTWVPEMSKKCVNLKRLDGKPIFREEEGEKEEGAAPPAENPQPAA